MTSIISIVVIILVLLVGALVVTKMRTKNTNSTSQTPSTTTSPSMALDKGSLTLVSNTLEKKGEKFTMFVKGNSNNKNINGYDVIITYDPTKVTFNGFENMLSDFQLIQVGKENKTTLTFTGAKRLNTAPTQLKDTNLMSLSFTAVQEGDAVYSLTYQAGSRQDSNLVDTNNTDVLGNVTGITVSIK